MSQTDTQPKRVGDYDIHLKGRGRMFKSDFLEMFSHCHGLTPLFVFVPLVGLAFYLSYTQTDFGFWTTTGLAVCGVFFWTFAEYWLHRKLFHFSKFPKFHYFIHGVHHVYPNDRGRMVMPPGASLVMAVPIYFAVMLAMGYEASLSFFAGFLGGYLWYDMTHYWTHVGKPKTAWGKMLRRNHMLHHFSTPEERFGVSTPLWDIVFGTYGERQTKTAHADR